MLRNRVIIHARHTDTVREYFFSTNHCQGMETNTFDIKIDLKGFVPTTYYLPMTVVPRPSLPSGRVETLSDILLIFYSDYTEIPNPDPKYQP
jgi:hypothetical protein